MLAIKYQLHRMDEVAYLLVANGEFALRLLVGLRVFVKLLDSIVVEDFLSKFDVAFSVFVAWVDLSVVGQGCESLIQGFVHLLWRALEKASASSNEHGVTGEHCTILAIFEEKADTILSVTGRV
jgi:hypothetical protein